jgi:hypothetical protein
MCFLITFDILNIMLLSHTTKKDKDDALAFARATLLVLRISRTHISDYYVCMLADDYSLRF